jgi:2-keto-4-pentenoate hydratase
MASLDDPRLRAGLERQLAARAAALEAGATPLGWKAGYGAPAVLEALSLSGPLVGYMTDAHHLDDGATLDVSGYRQPAVEAEIAVRLRVDVEAGATRDQVADAIDAIAPAIEVVDFDGTSREDVEAVLAANIFHRHVVVGTWDEGRAGVDLAGITVDVQVGDTQPARDADPTALPGDPLEVVRWMADQLGLVGERLRGGEIVITGTVIPPTPVSPGDAVRVHYAGLGDVGIDIT